MGTTASGKSELALWLAGALDRGGCPVELVSMDSMQVYRGMDIGTAKPSAEERLRVAHHLIDVAEVSEDWDLTRHLAAAEAAVAAIESRGRRALLVGGTGLYVNALVDRLRPPGRWPEVRAELESEQDTAVLYRRLAQVDPPAAARMEPANRRRVVRALEVTLGSGRPFSSYGPGVNAFPRTSWRLAGLWLPRSVVAKRIAHRLASMVASGLVEEVAGLAAKGMSRTARQALGYREILAHLEGGVPLEEAVSQALRRTRAFARRQRVWWRRDPRVVWYGAAENPLAVGPVLLADWLRP